jgi:protein-S-isoprenylcysteine O-methyltransferase Ste14
MGNTGIVLYFIGLAFSEALRLPRRFARLQSRGEWHAGKGVSRLGEFMVLFGIVIGLWMLPGIYAFTGLLDSHNYPVPQLAVWIAELVFVIGLVLRWLAHRTLAGLWSGTVELTQDHALVTNGIYGYIRHPIYASLILWALCQPVLLPNAVAGWSGLSAVLLLWLVRVPKEEAMMLAQFGEEYRQYAARTGRFLPKLKFRKRVP